MVRVGGGRDRRRAVVQRRRETVPRRRWRTRAVHPLLASIILTLHSPHVTSLPAVRSTATMTASFLTKHPPCFVIARPSPPSLLRSKARSRGTSSPTSTSELMLLHQLLMDAHLLGEIGSARARTGGGLHGHSSVVLVVRQRLLLLGHERRPRVNVERGHIAVGGRRRGVEGGVVKWW